MLLDKFLDYVSYDTTSDENSNETPSTSKQLLLANHLYEELLKLDLTEVIKDDKGFVYAYLKGDKSKPSIGLLAHIDTSSSASGKDIKPRIIENYDGKDIELNPNLKTSVERFPNLNRFVGKTIVVTDGNTLLGADDKAGVAIIFEALETIIKENICHGDIRIAFTPDEEVGRGTENFNYDWFKVDFAYTLDGSDVEAIEYENFNAASALVNFTGISVHPGEAKDKMVNAISLACEFNSYLDPLMVPEHTEGYEGFNHVVGMSGEVLNAKLAYILRNHDLNKLNDQKTSFYKIGEIMNKKYGYEAVKVEIKDSYRNMKEKFIGNMYPIELVKKAMANVGLDYVEKAIRGGTDGAALTWNGILCPNLGTGGDNYHGVHEVWCLDDGLKALELVLEMVKIA